MSLLAYHGSDHKINKFSDEFAGAVNAIDAEGPGIYITNSKDNAMMWGKFTYTLTLSPRKFISNTKPSSKTNRKDMKRFLDTKGEDYTNNWSPDIETDKITAINEAIRYNETEDEAWHSLRREQYNGSPQNFMRAMSKLGYDMMALKKEFNFKDVNETYHYIVYNPEIIEIVSMERNANMEEVRKIIREAINDVVENNDTVVYHGTSSLSWEKNHNIDSSIYLTNNLDDAKEYAYETAANDEMNNQLPTPIVCSINLETLKNTHGLQFQPDWGGHDVNSSSSWNDTFDKFGSFSVHGDIDKIKLLFKISKLKVSN